MRNRRAVAIGLACAALAQLAWAGADNGIHVGRPKVYDGRDLSLMLDRFSRQLPVNGFIDTKALASALGNLQGYAASDSSLALFANAAVGPQASALFSGGDSTGGTTNTNTAGANATPGSPTVTINLAPAASATTTPATGSATLGPQAPALAPLQTAPAYTPAFGASASDLLSDQVSLTYQISNLRMLLDRSLSDRLYHGRTRLQAVLGFDIDIEPDAAAKRAAAVVEVKVTLAGNNGDQGCNADDRDGLSLIALMPEQGSHNAATLSQKADAYGGAIAGSVFSLGVSDQERSQTFYLYRDMDTVSFQASHASGSSADLTFGWQFRPVLGRQAVDPGIRHLIAVVGLPCADTGAREVGLDLGVRTSWVSYDDKARVTTGVKPHFWSPDLPDATIGTYANVEVPTADAVQSELGARIRRVRWIPTDSKFGVAIVEGENFFQDTSVRVGSKSFANVADGLVIKSDRELELTLPVASAAAGGVVSGRYGAGIPLESAPDTSNAVSLERIASIWLGQEGKSTTQIEAELDFTVGQRASLEAALQSRNDPMLLLNGDPIVGLPRPQLHSCHQLNVDDISGEVAGPSALGGPHEVRCTLTAFAPSSAFAEVSPVVSVVFPFAGPDWSASQITYKTSLAVSRLGGGENSVLLIQATNPAAELCRSAILQLGGNDVFELLAQDATAPRAGALRCLDKKGQMLRLDLPSRTLKPYHHFLLLTNTRDGKPRAPLIGDIPPADAPPPGPTLDKGQVAKVNQNDVRTVKYSGKNLDQVTKVLFDKTALTIVSQTKTEIVVGLSREITNRPREDVELQLISDGNDPVLAKLVVLARKPPPAETKKG
jgi:hypothetical protein